MSGSSDSMREGFLCPICMTDLGDVIQLQVHFDEKHSKEDPKFVKNLKELFGKAKNILNEDNKHALAAGLSTGKKLLTTKEAGEPSIPQRTNFFGPRAEELQYHPVSGVARDLWIESPSPPPIASHWDYFRSERKKRLDRNKSTNQVLVRLEKLLSSLPSDPAKRRAYEQAIVPWIAEDLVDRCPTCAKSFNVARRKHHCRLCGSIMCKDCSAHIPLEFAKRVIRPSSLSTFQPSEENSALLAVESSPAGKSRGGKFRLSGSHESLTTLMTVMELKGVSDQGIRACVLCRDILQQQEKRSEVANADPATILLLYDRLQEQMMEGRRLAAEYTQMQESLSVGEDMYELEDAKYLRVKLLKVGEAVGSISKRIQLLNADPAGERMASPTELKLQMRIRTRAINFVKSTLVVLPSLPSESDYDQLKKRRKQEAERKVLEEKKAARIAKEKFEQKRVSSPNKDLGTTLKGILSQPNLSMLSQSAGKAVLEERVNHGQGFVLTSSTGANGADFATSEDPMVQQIHNIRCYIMEARKMGKHEEVKMLEENLKDLQAEYQRIQEERQELEDNFNSFKGLFHKYSSSREPSPEEEVPDMDEYDASGKNPFF